MTRKVLQGSSNRAAVRAPRWCRPVLPLVVLAAVSGGCTTTPQRSEASPVRVCAAGECDDGKRYAVNQLLHAIGRLFQVNDGADIKFCSADPETRVCTGDDVGYFVLGGLIPGRGASSSGKISHVAIDAENQVIHYVMAMHLSFLGTPLVCADHDAALTARSVSDLTIVDNSYYCNWLGVGNMTASFSVAIDSVDFDQGRIGGYWKHGVTGTGNGRGHGYALILFPESMPRSENWLVRR